jgi:hypothetical protein
MLSLLLDMKNQEEKYLVAIFVRMFALGTPSH